MEFDCIYKIRDQIKEILSINQIKFTEIKSENSFLYDMLVRPVKYRNPKNKKYPMHYGYEWCGGNARWGTSSKLSSIKKYYKDTYGNEEIYEYVVLMLL